MPLKEARAKAQAIVDFIKPYCERIEIAGSIRRGKDWIGDIEIVCIPETDTRYVPTDLFRKPLGKDRKERTPEFLSTAGALIAKKVKGDLVKGRYVQFKTKEGDTVDLFMATPENWGYIFAIRTGSVDFSKMIAGRWKQLGYAGQDGMLTKLGKPIPVPEESDLFDRLGLITPLPHLRELTADGLKRFLKQ